MRHQRIGQGLVPQKAGLKIKDASQFLSCISPNKKRAGMAGALSSLDEPFLPQCRI
ncbi:hypothetical protein BOSEA31B_10276 [Hyphomicrobiales bacterium]|nr:hypothetical protein BOSEA31B_10276 [Hyphomicrobiales bacterium]CAH1701955.1 hypothetical protein BOSEA1005_21654 [Hyphomicrobiales bacterium]CAI0346112.1 hypothetical protein BO1005MUT1_470270 [Hyphomicrobiales bacterium]